MKVLILDFGGMLTDALKAVGHEHCQVVEAKNPLDVVEKFFNAGMAVAIQKSQREEWQFVVSVDTHMSAFRQR